MERVSTGRCWNGENLGLIAFVDAFQKTIMIARDDGVQAPTETAELHRGLERLGDSAGTCGEEDGRRSGPCSPCRRNRRSAMGFSRSGRIARGPCRCETELSDYLEVVYN